MWTQGMYKCLVQPRLVIRKVVMNCVRQTPTSLFGDVPDLDCAKAAEIAKDRKK